MSLLHRKKVRRDPVARQRCRAVLGMAIVMGMATLAGCGSRPLRPVAQADDSASLRRKPAARSSSSAAGVNLSASAFPVPHAGDFAAADTRPQTVELRLLGAIFLAVHRNPDLETAKDSVDSAMIGIRATRSDFLWTITPRLTASVGESGPVIGYGLDVTQPLETGARVTVGVDTTRSDDDTYTSSATVTVNQPLLRGFGRMINTEGIRRAKRGWNAAETARVRLVEQIIIEAASTFFDILEQRLSRELNRSSRDRLEKILAASKAKEKLGLATTFDVYRAEIQLAQAKQALAFADDALGISEDAMERLMDLPNNYQFALTPPRVEFPETVDIDVDKACAIALHKRRDLLETGRRFFRDSIVAEKIAAHNTLPSLNLNVTVGRQETATAFDQSAHLNDNVWSVGLSTDWDVLRRRKKLSVAQARINTTIAQRTWELSKRQVRRDVKAQIRALKVAARQGRINETNVYQVEQKLKFAQMRYQRGMADNFELIQAEEELVTARLALFRAQRDLVLSRLRLLRAMGVLYDLYENNTLFRMKDGGFKIQIE